MEGLVLLRDVLSVQSIRVGDTVNVNIIRRSLSSCFHFHTTVPTELNGVTLRGSVDIRSYVHPSFCNPIIANFWLRHWLKAIEQSPNRLSLTPILLLWNLFVRFSAGTVCHQIFWPSCRILEYRWDLAAGRKLARLWFVQRFYGTLSMSSGCTFERTYSPDTAKWLVNKRPDQESLRSADTCAHWQNKYAMHAYLQSDRRRSWPSISRSNCFSYL